MNVKRRDKPITTDMVYSDTPAIDNRSTSAEIFIGTETLQTGISTLEDNIRKQEAMNKLISDRS